jgi:Predicted nucleic acid-binding protein, contains PIN domain
MPVKPASSKQLFSLDYVPRIEYGAGLAPLTAHPCATPPACAGMTNILRQTIVQRFLRFFTLTPNSPELSKVFTRVLQQRDEHTALHAIALMQQGRVVNLDSDIALRAAKHSIEYKLPMADENILAAARAYEVVIWTQDADFKNIKGVKYYSKAG